MGQTNPEKLAAKRWQNFAQNLNKFNLICTRLLFHLFAEPSTEIISGPDLYIESGSTINLTCVVYNSPEPPAYIFWNHNNAVSAQLYTCHHLAPIKFYLPQVLS